MTAREKLGESIIAGVLVTREVFPSLQLLSERSRKCLAMTCWQSPSYPSSAFAVKQVEEGRGTAFVKVPAVSGLHFQ